MGTKRLAYGKWTTAMMVPNKFGRIDRRCLAFVMSVVFTTAASPPIYAQPQIPLLSQLSTAVTPTPSGMGQPKQVFGGQLVVFVGHKGNINSVKFSPDGTHILTASDDNTARLWDREGKLITVFQHDDQVKSAVFSPDGDLVLTTSGHRSSLYLWEKEGRLLASLRGGRITKFSPDDTQTLPHYPPSTQPYHHNGTVKKLYEG
ncbi:hypothetical protein IQ277_20675 [Nostocales cyanobacterium LEGE 12452]|nr:hypothetical protein [Nostocales cyanobacterium LEGE 12452]